MIRLYKYLYYRLYSWNLKKWGEKDFPQWNALFGVSFMILLNLGIIAGVLDAFGLNLFFEDTPKKEILIVGLIVLILNYYWLLHKERYKQVVSVYKNESKKKRKRNMLLIWLYVILSFAVYGFIAVISGKVKGLH